MEFRCFRGTEVTRALLQHDLQMAEVTEYGEERIQSSCSRFRKDLRHRSSWLTSVGLTRARLHKFRCRVHRLQTCA